MSAKSHSHFWRGNFTTNKHTAFSHPSLYIITPKSNSKCLNTTLSFSPVSVVFSHPFIYPFPANNFSQATTAVRRYSLTEPMLDASQTYVLTSLLLARSPQRV